MRIEGNYFDAVGTAVFTTNSDSSGYVQLFGNHFGSSAVTTTPPCDLQIPYQYSLDSVESIPSIITSGVRTAVDERKILGPLQFQLEQNYPNPFNPKTVISYQLPVKSIVSLKLYDILGREVATLVNEIKSAGNHAAVWNAKHLPSGIYFCRLAAGGFTQIKKLALIK